MLVALCVLALYAVVRLVHHRPWVRQVRRLSKSRGWALDLRLSLLILFGLAWVAQSTGTSVLVAGFGVGLMVAAIGGPKRLSRQVTGVAQGLMVPLFFVVFGARLDLRALARHRSLLALAVELLVLNLVVHGRGGVPHAAAVRCWRSPRPPSSAFRQPSSPWACRSTS